MKGIDVTQAQVGDVIAVPLVNDGRPAAEGGEAVACRSFPLGRLGRSFAALGSATARSKEIN